MIPTLPFALAAGLATIGVAGLRHATRKFPRKPKVFALPWSDRFMYVFQRFDLSTLSTLYLTITPELVGIDRIRFYGAEDIYFAKTLDGSVEKMALFSMNGFTEYQRVTHLQHYPELFEQADRNFSTFVQQFQPDINQLNAEEVPLRKRTSVTI